MKDLELFAFSRTEDGFEIPSVPQPPARRIDTSRAAARGAQASSMRERVFVAIAFTEQRGATRLELEQTLGMKVQSLCARLWELEGGKLVDGRRQWTARIQKTAAVRDGCHVYVVTNYDGVR